VFNARGRGRVAEAGVASADDRFGPAGDLEFGEDGRGVVADGLDREAQSGRDAGVGQICGEQAEHLPFASGQLGKCRFGGAGWAAK
jgi:hypothetical protein